MAIAPGEKAETRKLAQEVGARSVAQLEAGLARIMGETGANNRWLLGALVLLNGGGIALLPSVAGLLDGKSIDAASTFFVMGAALAVLAALMGLGVALIFSRQIGEAIALWTQVGTSGEISDGALKAAATVRRIGLIGSLISLGLGFLSLVLFVAGAMTLGTRLANHPDASSEPPPKAETIVPAPASSAIPPLPQRTPIATPQSAPLEQPKPAPVVEAKPAPEKPAPKAELRRRAPRAENPSPAAPTPAPTAPAPAGGTPGQ